MINRQPFYHRIVVTFTSADGIDEETFRNLIFDDLIRNHLNGDDLFDFDIEEWNDGEPGDPADLL